VSAGFVDNSEEVLRLFEEATERALEKIGLVAEGYAKKLTPVDTGRLRNSISHEVDGQDVYIGTNVEYAPYVEMGTVRTKAQPFLKPAATEHSQTYKGILESEYKNG
jgi:HK97 gp10 family phage protein